MTPKGQQGQEFLAINIEMAKSSCPLQSPKSYSRFMLTLATLLVRLTLGFSAGDPPLLILFTFPIVVSAYMGGLGPGVLATQLMTLLSNYALLPPQYAFSLTTRLTLLQSGVLLGAGILISVLSEELHRARVRAEAGQQLQALTLASIGDAVITTDTHGHIAFLNPQAERLIK